MIAAWILPLSNDEAYYWDWGHALHLSYKDHPPGISWLTFLSSIFSGIWQVRILVPVIYTAAFYFSLKTWDEISKKLTSDESLSEVRVRGDWLLFIITLTSPGLFFLGSIAVPDIGLVCFMQVAIYLLIRWSASARLSWKEGVLLGLFLGLAGLFKYHALPLALGSLLGFIFVRRRELTNDLLFYLTVFVVGFLVCLPVWIWNLDHDFASIRYQSEHGFASGEWSLRFPLQGLLGVALVLSPALFLMFYKAFFSRKENLHSMSDAEKIALPGALVLVAVVFISALRKAILPHWVLPAFWLILPFLVARMFKFRFPRLLKWHVLYGSFVMVIVALLSMGLKARQHWLNFFDGDPSFLTELTVWQPLARSTEQKISSWQSDLKQVAEQTGDCSGKKIYPAGVRWYTSAQLRYHLQGSPLVLLISDNPYDYYNLRDAQLLKSACFVAVVLAPGQNVPDLMFDSFSEYKRTRLTVNFHEKQNWQLVLLARR